MTKGSKGEEFLKRLTERQEEFKKKVMESSPPQEIIEYIEVFAEKTNKLNNGSLDKQTFKLGMMAMWYHLNKKTK